MINSLFPGLEWIDARILGWLPFVLRLFVWGAVAGALSMGLYAWLSPQRLLTDCKQRGRELRRRMMDTDLEFPEFLGLSRQNLAVSLKLAGAVLGPVVVSVLPPLFFAGWLHTSHAFSLPHDQGSVIEIVRTEPPEAGGRLSLETSEKPEVITIREGSKTIYSGNPFQPPTASLYRRHWWNNLVGNPAGYLRDTARVKAVYLSIPKRTVLAAMPAWGEGWEFPFFLGIFVAALGLKLVFKIE